MDVNRIHETVVQVYLGADKGLFVNPQYPIRQGGRVLWLVDFLAVDFRVRQVWLVEITRAAGLARIRDKLGLYGKQLGLIRANLAAASGIGDDFQLAAWLFLREDRCTEAAGLEFAGLPVRVTPLERALRSWTWLNPDGETRDAEDASMVSCLSPLP